MPEDEYRRQVHTDVLFGLASFIINSVAVDGQSAMTVFYPGHLGLDD